MAKSAPNNQRPTAGTIQRRHQMPRLFHDTRRRMVGLLGGSFNPAHEGHLHSAIMAKRALGLDEIWWLVTPQNPLKSANDLAPLAQRLAYARKIAAPHSFIKVIAPEQGMRDNYTYKSLVYLNKIAPHNQFFWIMGADNLVQFPKWHRHRDIASAIPIAVIDRPSYSYKAIGIGRLLLSRRLAARQLGKLALRGGVKAPVWCFISGRRHHASATALRALGAGLQTSAFSQLSSKPLERDHY
jgi:nicotinate-nucleotide adenylyltransferase